MKDLNENSILNLKNVLVPRVKELQDELRELNKEVAEIKQTYNLRLNINDYTLEEIKKEVSEILNVDFDKISSKTSKAPYPDVRKLFSYFAFNNTKFSKTAIGEAINRDHSSVVVQIKEANYLISYDKEFIKMNELLNFNLLNHTR